MLLFTLKQRVIIFLSTVLTIAVFGGIGFMAFGGIGLAIGAVLSFPVAQWIIVHQMKKEGERIAKEHEKTDV